MSTQGPASPAPGWYDNPEGAGRRYWDGTNWTDQFSAPDDGGALPPPTGALPPPVVAPARVRYGVSPAYWVAALSVVAMVVGSIGPWITAGDQSVDGTSRDGALIITLAVVVAILLGVYRAYGQRGVLIAAAVVGAIGTITCIADLIDIHNKSNTSQQLDGPALNAGWGIYVALAGCVILAISSLLARASAQPR